MMSARLDVFLPLPLTDRGPAYTCGMIARGMAGDELDVTVTTPRARAHPIAPARIIQVLPHWARYVPYSWVRSIAASKIESTFRSQVNVNPSQMHAAYIWPDASIGTIKELKEAEVKMFREMINCNRGTAKRILDDAYARIGAVPNHTITDASVIAEQEALDAADYIFCPNSMVEASLFENGLPASKIVPASYGWDPCVFMGRPKSFNHVKASPLYLQERYASAKGCHLLLEYWAKSKVRGRLVLAGAMEPIIKDQCAALLARDDVVVLDFVQDVGALYRSADILVFPSLEEGGPQVTYEACGCGLPVVTTPMGAGRIVRHNREGFVLDPYAGPGWVAAIRALAGDKDLRAGMSGAAAQRAQLFRWEAVAERRKKQVMRRLSGDEAMCSPISWSGDDCF
jgi:glycosyltransferase involved in cell wall biosynthesis